MMEELEALVRGTCIALTLAMGIVAIIAVIIFWFLV